MLVKVYLDDKVFVRLSVEQLKEAHKQAELYDHLISLVSWVDDTVQAVDAYPRFNLRLGKHVVGVGSEEQASHWKTYLEQLLIDL